jgi:two-component system chemotaxis response regulator CheB
VSPAPATVVVGLGASAGGVEALCSVVGGLSPDLPAAVIVVLHLSPAAPSVLDDILRRSSRLPVSFVTGSARLEAGRVYVAPPNHHLVVDGGLVRTDRGPTVNAVRPSVDVLFASLADEYGPRAIGVVLSGTLDDGAAGLLQIKEGGGRTIVQDPEEAGFPGMPEHAIALAGPDQVAPAAEIPARIADAVRAIVPEHGNPGEDTKAGDPADPGRSGPPGSETHGGSIAGRPSELTCPECGGVLWAEGGEEMTFRCRVGHAYSPGSLMARHTQKVEEALWSAVVALEERADLFRRVGRRLGRTGGGHLQRRFQASADSAREKAQVLRDAIPEIVIPPLPGDRGPVAD